MLKVGEFSRLSQVTVATLHHYDAIGLLKPAHTDPFTNYRYYAVEQLTDIHRIMVLKELGLGFDQISQIIATDLSIDQLRGMARLARIRFHLRQLELGTDQFQFDVRLKPIKPFQALTSRHQFGSHSEIPPVALDVLRWILPRYARAAHRAAGSKVPVTLKSAISCSPVSKTMFPWAS